MVRKILIVFCVLGIILCTSVIVTSSIKDVTEYVRMRNVNKRVKETKHTNSNTNVEVTPDNPCLPTWITEPTGLIDLPIMHYTDNSFYLEHDAEGNPSKYGAIFLDAIPTREPWFFSSGAMRA